jgi:CRISPR system Cascade subunit CasA
LASFNLIDEPWISCTSRDGPAELGLRAVFAHAHEIVEIADPSPIVTLALHRLLLAIAHRVFGPENADAWAEMRERGEWDMEQVDRYFARTVDRFDLFSATHPFFQAADLDVPAERFDAYKLVMELGTANTSMFSDVDRINPPSLSPAQAARALVSIQPFHRTGNIGDKRGPGKLPCEAGPLAGAAVCLILGSSLYETLLLNMVDYSASEGLPFKGPGTDLPAWERDAPPQDVERRPAGYLDWLTWITWIARLVPDQEEGQVTVRRARIVRGARLPKGEEERRFETMVAYSISEKYGYRPLPLRRERAVWRDSAALFQSSEARDRPKTLSQISERVEEAGLEPRATFPLSVCGVAFQQASALFWRNDRLPLPLVYLDDVALFGKVHTALGLAEEAGDGVQLSGQMLAAHLLKINLDGKLDRSARERLRDRVTSLGAGRQYWAALDPFFTRFLVDQAAGSDVSLAAWAQQVMDAARAAFEYAELALPHDGESLHARVQARACLEAKLARARSDHPIPQASQEGAL